MTTIDSAYLNSLLISTAILSLKLMLLHLLVIRTRLMSQFFVTPEDNPNDPLLPFVKMALFGFGTDFGGKQFVERVMRITRNCAENEPFFIVLALLAGMAQAVAPEVGITSIQVFTGGRIVHTLFYLTGPIIGGVWRSTAWTVGCSATMYLAWSALSSSLSSSAVSEQ